MVANINGHKLYSSTKAISNSVSTTFTLIDSVVEKEWLYPINNSLSIEVLNTLATSPQVIYQTVTFNCGYSSHYDIRNSGGRAVSCVFEFFIRIFS